jgi:hypothetical protein
MRALVAGLALCSACAGPVLELRVARTDDPGQVELTVLARDGADLPGHGTVHLQAHHPTPTIASLPLDASGSASLVLDCETACDTVRATATWQGVEASLKERLTPVTVSGTTMGGATPSSPGITIQRAAPAVAATTTSVPVGSRYFGGGDVELTLAVVNQGGSPTAARVTLETGGRRLDLLARADGLVTFFDVPAGPAHVSVATESAEPCVEDQPCSSAWTSNQTTLVVGRERSQRHTVRSGW